MRCEQVLEQFPGLWDANADPAMQAEVQRHLDGCAGCSDTVRDLATVWNGLGALPAERPSAALRVRFDAMLDAYQQGLQHARPGRPSRRVAWRPAVSEWLDRWWPRQPAMQLTLAVLCLVLGLTLGPRLPFFNSTSPEFAALRNEVRTTRQLVTLSLLQQRSPSERLRGVSWSSQMDQADPAVLKALLDTLNDDPNVDVRLAAADALSQFRNEPEVRQGLVQALSHQDSPLVQIALIDLLVQIKEPRSVTALQHLVHDDGLNQAVRRRAQWGLQQLL